MRSFLRWLGRAWLMAILPIPAANALVTYGVGLYFVGGTLTGVLWVTMLLSPVILMTGLLVWVVRRLRARYALQPNGDRWRLALEGLVGALIGLLALGWAAGLVAGVASLVATHLEEVPQGRRWVVGLGAAAVMTTILSLIYWVQEVLSR